MARDTIVETLAATTEQNRADGAPEPIVAAPPLPAGMRDLLPEETRQQSAIARRVLRTFDLFGYERVSVPAFEYASVLEQGIGALDPRESVRFLEAESGELVALRPDMTPQIARLLVSRLAALPPPARLSYEGSVLRRRSERSRRHRQIRQAGIELLGSGGPDGDVEVVTVAAAALDTLGLAHTVLDVGHVGIPSALLAAVPRARWAALTDALASKDQPELERRGRVLGIAQSELRALVALTELHGPSGDDSSGGVWAQAERALSGTGALAPARELRRLCDAIHAAGIGARLSVDLGESWNFDYYTGMTFQVHAAGPGEPVGSGGRYDELLARFGVPRPAAGFAFDLDNLAWALRAEGLRTAAPQRVLVDGSLADVSLADGTSGEALISAVLGGLRAAGIATQRTAPNRSDAYAQSWAWSHRLARSADGAAALFAVPLAEVGASAGAALERALVPRLPETDPAALVAAVVAALSERPRGELS